MLTLSDIFFDPMSSTLVSDLYGLLRRILYIIFIAPHSKFTMQLVKNRIIKNDPLSGVHICMQCGY